MKKNEYHGYRHHPLYEVWCSIKQRCTNPNNKAWENYGGRGICICAEWEQSAKLFIEWGTSNGWEKGLDIDRINNDRWYTPENCRFVTRLENIKNTRLISKSNTSGYRGVSFCRPNNAWFARVSINNKSFYIGAFPNKVDAAVHRDSFVISNKLGLPLNFNPCITKIAKRCSQHKDKGDL